MTRAAMMSVWLREGEAEMGTVPTRESAASSGQQKAKRRVFCQIETKKKRRKKITNSAAVKQTKRKISGRR